MYASCNSIKLRKVITFYMVVKTLKWYIIFQPFLPKAFREGNILLWSALTMSKQNLHSRFTPYFPSQVSRAVRCEIRKHLTFCHFLKLRRSDICVVECVNVRKKKKGKKLQSSDTEKKLCRSYGADLYFFIPMLTHWVTNI